MSKNIILCADGTGNRGGYTPNSNVFEIYNAIKRNVDLETEPKQITFYDNGVGTSVNKTWKAVTGAIGLGFKKNVCDLYRFLCLNYKKNDKVFLFGFSRGAATVRALSGFIYHCGLIEGEKLINSENYSHGDLVREIEIAFQKYKNRESLHYQVPTAPTNDSHRAIPIHFIGIWDTVSALGAPQRTHITGPFSWLTQNFFSVLDYGMDRVGPHRFYDYELNDKVEHAYQALSIDDERTAFWPMVWDETGVKADHSVEQVWFAGVHANVGGGYQRNGMAKVPLYWMMEHAERHGLIFKDGSLQKVEEDANVNDMLYDSRGGFARMYRYHPREIENLCKNKMTDVKIHSTVVERMDESMAKYAPCLLPERFSLVDIPQKKKKDGESGTQKDVKKITIPQSINANWQKYRKKVENAIAWRKRLYSVFMLSLAVVMGFTYKFWVSPPESLVAEKMKAASMSATEERLETDKALNEHIADVLNYFLPDMFNGLIHYTVVKNWGYFLGAVIFALVIFQSHQYLLRMIQKNSHEQNKLLLKLTDKAEDSSKKKAV